MEMIMMLLAQLLGAVANGSLFGAGFAVGYLLVEKRMAK